MFVIYFIHFSLILPKLIWLPSLIMLYSNRQNPIIENSVYLVECHNLKSWKFQLKLGKIKFRIKEYKFMNILNIGISCKDQSKKQSVVNFSIVSEC